MLEGAKVCVSTFMSVCRAVGRGWEALPFTYPSVTFLTLRPYCEFRCDGTLGLRQKEGSFHIFICQVLWTCMHTHWAHGSSLPLKRIHVLYRTEMCCLHCPNPHLLFLSCTLAEGLGAELLDMTPRRERVGTDMPFFPLVLTSTCRLVCVHGVVLKNSATEPSASGNRTKGRVYLVPGVSSSIPDSHVVSISTKCPPSFRT